MGDKTMFTPGPWGFGEYRDLEAVVEVAVKNTPHSEPHLASIATASGWTPAEVVANARLISAAPDLYEALLALVGPDGDLHDMRRLERAQKALAKAEGR